MSECLALLRGTCPHNGTDTDPPAGDDDGQMLPEAEVQVLSYHMIDHLGCHPAQVHLQQSLDSCRPCVWGWYQDEGLPHLVHACPQLTVSARPVGGGAVVTSFAPRLRALQVARFARAEMKLPRRVLSPGGYRLPPPAISQGRTGMELTTGRWR